MGDQRQITGHVEITGLGCNGKKLKGKTVTVFTIDGNVVRGEVLGANFISMYLEESSTHTRLIKASAIASISMDREDADELLAKETPSPVLSPDALPKKPIIVRSELPRF